MLRPLGKGGGGGGPGARRVGAGRTDVECGSGGAAETAPEGTGGAARLPGAGGGGASLGAGTGAGGTAIALLGAGADDGGGAPIGGIEGDPAAAP
jgi:hypothetical protein